MRTLKPWILASLLFSTTALAATPVARCPVMFFDLGQALVDTKTDNFNPIFYLVPGPGFADGALFPTGKEYIDKLTQHFGLSVGLLIDVPGVWGTRQDPPFEPISNLLASKFLRTQEFLLGHALGDPNKVHPDDHTSFRGVPFDWTPFGGLVGAGPNRVLDPLGRIFQPVDDAHRKSAGSLDVFQRGMAVSRGCPVIYQSSIEAEMPLAARAGMIPFWVGHTSKSFYLPPDQIIAYIQFAKKSRPAGAPEFWRGPF